MTDYVMNAIPGHLRGPLRRLLYIQRILLAVFSVVLAAVFFAVVVLRYGFEADLFAYEEWVLVVAFWLYFIGGAQGSYEDSHIKADFLSAFISNARVRWGFSILTNLLEFFVLAVLSYWAFLMVMEEVVQYPTWPATVAWKIPYALPRLGIFIGLLLMTFYSFLHLFVKFRCGPPVIQEA